MESRPLVFIIILNWNGWADTIACVESCLELSYPDYRVLIVDNGSSDGSEGILRERFSNVVFLQMGDNLGFAGGNNAGIHYALNNDADYVWLLNNDTIVAADALTELVEIAESDETIGIVGSKIYYYAEPDKIWFAGGIWDKHKAYASHRGSGEIDVGQYDEECEVGFITGCSLLIKNNILKHIGLLKEDYFLYWEDNDLCENARRHGWKVYYSPCSKVWHKVSSSVIDQSYIQSYYYLRNGLLFFQRYAPRQSLRFLANSLVYTILNCRQNAGHILKGYLFAVKDFVLRRFGKKQHP